jgi:hypothetical protein
MIEQCIIRVHAYFDPADLTNALESFIGKTLAQIAQRSTVTQFTLFSRLILEPCYDCTVDRK